MLVSLAYQTHGEGWRLGAGADVDLHIQRQASGGSMLGVCMHVCVYVCVHAHVHQEKSNGLHECERGKEWGREWMMGRRTKLQQRNAANNVTLWSFHSNEK